MASSSLVPLKYLLGQGMKRVLRRKLATAFLYAAIPALVLFIVSLPWLGTTQQTLGVGARQVIPSSIPATVDVYTQPQPMWNSKRQLVWADASAGSGPLNVSALMSSLPGLSEQNTRKVDSEADIASLCAVAEVGPSSCFAALLFHPATPSAPLNFTLYSGGGAYGNPGVNVNSLGSFGAAFLLSLQMNVERAAASQLLPASSPSILTSVTTAVPFTYLTKRTFNELYLDYLYLFLGDTASAVIVMTLLPHTFWLANAVATDKETRTHAAMTIMGLPHWQYLLSLIVQYCALALPSWIMVAPMLGLFIVKTPGVASAVLVVLLVNLTLIPATISAASFFTKARLAAPGVTFAWFCLGAASSQVVKAGSAALTAAVLVLVPSSGLSIALSLWAKAELLGLSMSPSNWAVVVEGTGMSTGGMLACMAAGLLLHTALQYVLGQGNTLTSMWAAAHSCVRKHRVASLREGEAAAVMHESLLDTTAICEARDQEADKHAVVSLKGVSKMYPGAATASVRSVNLECVASEMLVLLGKNGCGKTTTVHMIAGLLQPTQGTIVMQWEEEQRHIGWCPQHDILWSDVTVVDTLALYAAIKGVPAADIQAEAVRWAQEAGLGHKLNALAGQLSGGQKRRLSLAVALIGPRSQKSLLLLDEPTAGVDPVNRRLLWDLINRNKEGRAVLLTTHFLDEAEALGDRIAVMDSGRLRAFGTSMYLKQFLSLGYTLSVLQDEADVAAHAAQLGHIVQGTCAAAKLLSVEKGESTFSLPVESRSTLSSLLSSLEAQADLVGIQGLELRSPSLRDVFMAVVGTGIEITTAKEQPADVAYTISQPSGQGVVPAQGSIPPAPPSTIAHASLRGTCMRMKATLSKRFMLSKRDKFATLLPLFLAAGASIGLAGAFRSEGPLSCPVTFNVQPPATLLTVDASATTPPYGPSKSFLVTAGSVSPVMPPSFLTPVPDMSAFEQTLRTTPAQVWAGFGVPAASAWAAAGTVSYDISLPLADLRALNAYNNALYAQQGPVGAVLSTVQYRMFPTKVSAFSSRDWRPYLAFMGVLVVLLAALVPLSSTLLVTRERSTGLKMQQYMSGLRPREYWSANFMWDALLVIATSLVLAAGLSSLPTWLVSFGPSFLLLLLYGLAHTALGYVMSFSVDTQAAAVTLHAALSFAVAIGYVVGFIVAAPDPTADAQLGQYLTYAALATHPLSALLMGFILPGANIVFALCSDESALGTLRGGGSALDVPVFRYAAIALAGHTVLAFFLLWLVETRVLAACGKRLRCCHCCQRKAATKDLQAPEPDECYSDADVLAERNRVVAAYGSGQSVSPDSADSVLIQDVKKRFWTQAKPLWAVKGVTLGLDATGCYGHLGPNGAGKTTLLRMLSGQERPDGGDVSVQGHKLSTDLAGLQRSIGVCPQFDVLYAELTPVEHIALFAALRGYPAGPATQAEVDRLIRTLDLTPHAHKPSGALSGGNKRKLCVALALVGDPSVVILDEPSTGMDPASKQFMWSVIQQLRRTRTVILTSHSMEEVQAVAQRVGIMVQGRMVALGPVQRLKSRFGQHYQVDAVCSSVEAASRVAQVLSVALPGTELIEQHAQQVRLRVPFRDSADKPVHLSQVLHVLEEHKESLGIRAYQTAQSTLEQIFIDLASKDTSLVE